MLPKRLPTALAVLVGVIVFLAIWGATKGMAGLGWIDGTAASQVVSKSLMFAVSLGTMMLVGRSPAAWGWAAPRRWIASTIVPIACGGVLGMAATATILLLGLPPMAGLSELGFLRIVLIVWFGSTIAEELFVRGLIQGWMQPWQAAPPFDVAEPASGAAARIVSSGLLFGGMHLTLFFSGNDWRTATLIVVATSLLGLVCAWSRERSGSLIGPLASHFAFNACALVGGIAVVVGRRLLGG